MDFEDRRKLFKLFEDLIRATKLIEYYPYNKKVDFTEGDIVQCSYMKGFFKVINTTNYYLHILPIELEEDSDNVCLVGIEFLKKVEVNQQVMKVLY